MADRKFPSPPPKEAEFQQALIDCGITKKGAGFARVAWQGSESERDGKDHLH